MSGNTINLKDGIKEAPSAHWLLIESYPEVENEPRVRNMSGNTINLKDGIKEAPSAHWLLIESYVDKRLVPLLRRLRDNNWRLDALSKEEFTNELMHEYANRVMSILKGVSGVLVAKDYVVIDYEVTEFKQGDYESTRFMRVLLGFDENGKLWLREIRDIPMSVTCDRYNDILICLTSNETIRSALGYNRELPNDGVIRDTGTYRVQGDLIMNVDIINIGEIRSWYEYSTTVLLKWKCMDRFYGELIRHGIDPDLREAYENPSEPKLRIRLMRKPHERSSDEYEIRRRAEGEFIYPLKDYVIKELSGGRTWSYPIKVEDVEVTCFVFPDDAVVRDYTVIMKLRFDVEDNHPVKDKLETLLLNHVINDIGNYTYKLGRHEIQAYNVVNPITVFRFPETWINDIQYIRPLPIGLMMVPTNYPRVSFIVSRDSRVVIKHPEHGEVTLGFDGFYMVTIETERRASTFTALMNETAIDKIKQSSEQRGGDQ